MSSREASPTLGSSEPAVLPAAAPSLRYAWYVVFILMLCYALSFIDRQILSLLVVPIKRDLHVSDTRIGLLQGLAFALFYTFMGLPLGRIADTHNRRRLISLGLFVWSILTAACGAARNFWTLGLARVGVGVGEATLAPAAFSLITDYFPAQRLGLALSTYAMGIFIGSGLAFIVGGTVVQALSYTPFITLPFLGAVASWRLSFLIVCIPGLLMLPLLLTVREPQRRQLLLTAEGRPSALSFREVLAQVRLRFGSVLGISLGMVFQSMCAYSFLAWGPTYLQRVHRWTPGQAGRALGVLTLFVGCLGMYLGGKLCDYWQQRGLREAPLRVAVLAAVGTGVLFPISLLSPSVVWMILFLVPALFFLAFPVGSSFAAMQLIFPNQVRGQVSAVLLFVLNLGGLSLGPLLPGILNDYFFHSDRMIGASLTITLVAASFLMWLVYLATYRPYRKHLESAQAWQSTLTSHS